MRVLCGMLALAGLCVASAEAGPLSRRVIDASATWLVHMDGDAMVASSTGRALLASTDIPVVRGVRRLLSDFGLDTLRDVHAMTMYGLGRGPEKAVTVITASVAADALGEHLQASGLSDVRSAVTDGFAQYSWVFRGERTWATVVPAGEGERYIILAPSTEDLARAVGVVRGTVPSQQTTPPEGVLAAEPGLGPLVFAAAVLQHDAPADRKDAQPAPGADRTGRDPDFAPMHAPSEAMVFRSARTLVLELGEQAGHPPESEPAVVGRLHMDMGDEANAQDCEAIVRGMLASGALMSRQRPGLEAVGRMVQQVKVAREGRALSVSMQPPVGVLVQFLSALERPGKPMAGETIPRN